MKRLYSFIILICCCTIVTYAQHVPIGEAKRVALTFLIDRKQLQDSIHLSPQFTQEKLSSFKTQDKYISIMGDKSLYLIQLEEGGWVLMSSDKRIRPILAYSIDGFFNDNDMPDNLMGLLADYESSIKYVQEKQLDIETHYGWNITQDKNVQQSNLTENRNGDVYIPRIHNTKWKQGASNSYCINSYNALCPQFANVDCDRNLVGCVAVALGLVLRNYKWPISASIPTIIDSLGHWDFPVVYEDSYYNWNYMPPKLDITSLSIYGTQVASLLRDCGYSVNMQYRYNGSGAHTEDGVYALKNIFGYSDNVRFINKNSHSSTWTDIIKDEINNQRPVIYRARGYQNYDSTEIKGHAFVVYGYNDDDMFMINWGWGEQSYSTDYFTLDHLFVYNYQDYYDFFYNHGAIIGIEPDYCATQKINPSDIWATNFTKAYTGNIDIGNRTIPSNAVGSITASNSIHLSHGFRILPGAKVSITIDGTPCESIGNNRQNSPERIQQKHNVENGNKLHDNTDRFYLSPNPVASILHINTSDKLSQVKIYNLNGQCVLQSAQTDIDVSALPQGMYILRAETTDGNAHQTKFIKQ